VRKFNNDSTHQQTTSSHTICPHDPHFKYTILNISDRNKHFHTQDRISQSFSSHLQVAHVLNTDTFVCIFPILNLHFSV